MLQFKNIKNFLLKVTLPIGRKKFLLLVKLKIQLLGLILLVTWMASLLLEVFTKKEFQKTSEEKIRIEKILKRKGDKLYVKWKGYDNSFNSWVDKKDLV